MEFQKRITLFDIDTVLLLPQIAKEMEPSVAFLLVENLLPLVLLKYC